ncbi:MAG: DUF2063 domain-containing protein [Methylotenera sp.]|nr:DUF2063 domain-containing protein [Methylotenera sp.]
MNHLAQLQADFQAYLLDDAQGTSFIEAVVDDKKVGAKKRLSIYHNAYRLRIIEALATAYPKLNALLGDVLFDNIAREYISAYPSTYRNLRWYGNQMREHLLTTLPQHPIAAEMADFEWTLSLAFDAEDVPELTLQDLATIPPENWADLSFTFQPAIKIVRTRWNTIPIWQALEADETPTKPAQESTYQSWLIWRKKFNSQFRLVTEMEVIALNMAMAGATFGEVCESLECEMDEEEAMTTAAQYLATWLQEGMISAVKQK